MERIHFGLAGLGHGGIGWLKHFQKIDGYRITVLCGRYKATHELALSHVSERLDVCMYEGYEGFLVESDVDAVALCVGCREQGRQVVQALGAGMYINATGTR
ncbi:uncharacterized protein METZ01_LOCUS243744 [marine metagenome]|uniref:Gfo/Idh/MocA-like oxidoreductase N-terminal domain-containing protein n=1 Tax=marine metagenome TaxID=408172 RepID=A0A382HUC2_9ZZZZ